jgi:hypothetical protein
VKCVFDMLMQKGLGSMKTAAMNHDDVNPGDNETYNDFAYEDLHPNSHDRLLVINSDANTCC